MWAKLFWHETYLAYASSKLCKFVEHCTDLFLATWMTVTSASELSFLKTGPHCQSEISSGTKEKRDWLSSRPPGGLGALNLFLFLQIWTQCSSNVGPPGLEARFVSSWHSTSTLVGSPKYEENWKTLKVSLGWTRWFYVMVYLIDVILKNPCTKMGFCGQRYAPQLQQHCLLDFCIYLHCASCPLIALNML